MTSSPTQALNTEQGRARSGDDDLCYNFTETRHSLLERYRNVRARTVRICEPLSTEDFVVQSMADASPTKWHLAHTSWFFETFVLAAARPDYQSPQPQYAYLFNSYYVQVGERYPRPKRGLITRPTVQEVFDYRDHLDASTSSFIEQASGRDWEKLAPVIEIGIQHEQQHQELILTDIKHALSHNPLHPVYSMSDELETVQVPDLKWIDYPEDLHLIGAEGSGFCYDNETPCHRSFLAGFQLGDRLATNADYMEFIADNGYGTPTLWLSEGWDHVERDKWQAPLYWSGKDGEWWCFSLAGLGKVNPAEPVCHISFFEADAFARWSGARLPTEEEWEVAAEGISVTGNFLATETYHPCPLSAPPSGDGPSQLFGDVWEWTRSPYVAYPGYRPMPGPLGEYNGKFMSSQIVLRGGSYATDQTHIRKTYRNFFPPAARWQFSGVRLARDV